MKCKFKFSTAVELSAGAAVIAAFLLVGCGGGGSGGNGITTVISGIVSDDPVAGATVTATSTDSGAVLGSATTAADGSYSLNVTTANIGAGYSLTGAGGTMNGQTFNGNLSAIYHANANSQQANLTLLTSALAEAANSTTRHTGTALQKHEAIKAEAIARGLIGTDYNQVQPTGTLMASLQNHAATSGAPAAISSQVQTLLSDPPVPGTCKSSGTKIECTQDVNPGESLSLTVQGATASAPVGALNSCRVIASFDEAGQSMAMWVENIPSTTPNSTAPFQCQITGNVTLTLPPLPPSAEAPDACLAPLSRGSSTPSCVTIGSGMTPSYFVDDGAGHNHRTGKNPHSSIPAFGRTVKFSRSYGAVLNASAPPALLAQNQWAGKKPVILVHGFTLGGGFGGDDGTWGILPQLIAEDPTVVVLNFQWKTDASFLTVAGELAKAVDYANLSTGNKVHIVAHSFGGVLSRVMLQNLRGDAANFASNVATLTTVGAPHSGIVYDPVKAAISSLVMAGISQPGGPPFEVEGQFLPQGGSSLSLKICQQISCYEAGQNTNLAPWVMDELACPTHIPICPAGTIPPTRGYINARLADFSNHSLPTGLKVLVLIGQIIEMKGLVPAFSGNDGLISYFGQRFIPQSSVITPLLSGTVTERILGLPAGANGIPDAPVGKNTVVTTYSYGSNYRPNNNIYPIGYRHNLWVPPWDEDVSAEVNVPESCGASPSKAATCQHDTWLNIKAFLQTGCQAGQVVQNGQCVASDSPVTISHIVAGNLHTLALKSDGSVWAWGDNGSGQLGDGSTIDKLLPVLVMAPGSGIVQLAAGHMHSLALKSDGSVWAWGDNGSGQLGDGSTITKLSPTQVMAPGSGVMQLVAGEAHSFAIKSDGSMLAWGDNGLGQLGDGSTITKLSPTQVMAPGSGVVQLASSTWHTLALKSDGSVWAWGSNLYGQLGDNTTADKHYPVQVIAPSSGVMQIEAGHQFSLALKADGSVWAWGYNGYGELGDNTWLSKTTPVQMMAPGSGVIQLATGSSGDHTLALKSDGSVWAWGDNTFGQLGDNTTAGRNHPVQVMAASSGMVQLAAAMWHSLTLKSDGSVWAWGDNGSGGLGIVTGNLVPTLIINGTGN